MRKHYFVNNGTIPINVIVKKKTSCEININFIFGDNMTSNKNHKAGSEALEKIEIPELELKDNMHPNYLEHREKILKLHQQGMITKTQIDAIGEIAPHLVDLAKSVANTASKVQSTILDAHKATSSKALDLQSEIIKRTQSEDALSKLSDNIVGMNKDNNQTQKELNKDNNELYKKLGFGVAGLAIGGIVGFLFGRK